MTGSTASALIVLRHPEFNSESRPDQAQMGKSVLFVRGWKKWRDMFGKKNTGLLAGRYGRPAVTGTNAENPANAAAVNSRPGGLLGLIAAAPGNVATQAPANSIFGSGAANQNEAAPNSIGFLAGLNTAIGGAQVHNGGSGAKPNTNSKKPQLCPDDQVRVKYYAPPDQVQRIVDQAVVQTSFSEYLIGLSGLEVNGRKRYVYSDEGWFDLQHVISAAFSVYGLLGVSEEVGILVEIGQRPWWPKSSFRGEDLRSNRIGEKAARIHQQSKFKKSIGQCVVEALSSHRLYQRMTAKHLILKKHPC